MDLDAHGVEREDLFLALLGDLHVEVDVDAALVELKGRDALVGQPQQPLVGAQQEPNLLGAQGETVELDGELRSYLAGGAEAGFPELEVIVSFYAQAEGKEGRVVDGFAGLKDEVLEEEVDFGGGDFEAGDGDVLDGLDEEGDEDVDCVADKVRVCVLVLGGEDVEDLGRRLDELGDVLILGDGVEGLLRLIEKGVHVVPKGGLGAYAL